MYIDFSRLVYKLPKYGKCGNVSQRLTSFLNNRKQRFKIGETFPGDTDISFGVSKAHAWVPYYLILHVSDLPGDHLTTNINVCLFADDTKIYVVFSDVSERPVTRDRFNESMVWAERWQLQAAEHNCCVLTIGNNTPATYHLTGV